MCDFPPLIGLKCLINKCTAILVNVMTPRKNTHSHYCKINTINANAQNLKTQKRDKNVSKSTSKSLKYFVNIIMDNLIIYKIIIIVFR